VKREPLVRVLPAASQAVADQADYYATVSESDLPERWRRAVEQSFTTLLTVPSGGSFCGLMDPKLAELRRWPIEGFPNHLILYRYAPESHMLTVVDVVHGAQDFPSRLSGLQNR